MTRQAGKLLIIAMFVVGLTLAGFGVWYHRQSGRRALELWGADAATLIARAPRVEALRIVPRSLPDAPGVPTLLQGAWDVIDQRDITAARGLIHMRTALLADASYDWESGPSAPLAPDRWHHALRFVAGNRVVTLAISLDEERIALIEPSLGEAMPSASIKPIAPGMAAFLAEQFADQTKAGE